MNERSELENSFQIHFHLENSLYLYTKSLIIVVENFYIYHWIQHKKPQPVVVTKQSIGRTDFCEPQISKTIKARNLKQRQKVQHIRRA